MQRVNGAPPKQAPRFFGAARGQGGWSLTELTIVIAVAAVLATVAFLRFRPLDVQAIQQAEGLRNDLRHMQMLALTWLQPLRLTTAAGSYSVACVTAGAAPCDVSPVIDPATGQPFSVSLHAGLSLTGPGFTLDFDAVGRPKNGASFITANATFSITGGDNARSVVVSPISGFAAVQ
jgi:prepilin-type N-terminal cleavage/methylation domain-containing protein